MPYYKTSNRITIAVLVLLVLLSFVTAVHWWYFGLLFAIRFVVLAVASFVISSDFHVNAFCRAVTTKKIIALTFDDGPDPNTLRILEVLRGHNAKATFFCIGKNIEKFPEIVKQLLSEGHAIGNHSYSHSRGFGFFTTRTVLQELTHTDRLIKAISGQKVLYFRPPFGVTNPAIRKAIVKTNHIVIGWSIRSLDGVIQNEQKLINRLRKRIVPGGIVLLHDNRKHTVNVLEQLLVLLEKQQYTVVSIEQLKDKTA